MITVQSRSLALHRLTALWALSECGLGGVLHLTSPAFTGLFVGGISIIILSLLCHTYKITFKELLFSLSTVLAIKLILSPHSSPTAYIAVSFQAVITFVFFKLFKNIYLAGILTGIVTMLESAMQKLIVLTIIYGNELWRAIDQWSEAIVKKVSFLPSFDSLTLVFVYVSIYFIGGIVFGYFCATIIQAIKKIEFQGIGPILLTQKDESRLIQKNSRALSFWITTSVLLVFVISSIFGDSSQSSTIVRVLTLLLRVILIMMLWYLFLAPWITKFLKKKLMANPDSQMSSNIQSTMTVLPYLRRLAKDCWQNTSGNVLKRMQHFLPIFIISTLIAKIEE